MSIDQAGKESVARQQEQLAREELNGRAGETEIVRRARIVDVREIKAQRDDLLAACKAVAEGWQQTHTALKQIAHYEIRDADAYQVVFDALCDWQDKARAAIARAEGKK